MFVCICMEVDFTSSPRIVVLVITPISYGVEMYNVIGSTFARLLKNMSNDPGDGPVISQYSKSE